MPAGAMPAGITLRARYLVTASVLCCLGCLRLRYLATHACTPSVALYGWQLHCLDAGAVSPLGLMAAGFLLQVSASSAADACCRHFLAGGAGHPGVVTFCCCAAAPG